mgnify:CR=1 FL=1
MHFHPEAVASAPMSNSGAHPQSYVADGLIACHACDGLHRIAREIAFGQSAVGTWGHMFARPNGNCNGYGCMNAPGLVLLTAMTVAREAGVKDPDVDRAIAKGGQFLRWYVNKGAIPYGDHQPWPGHEDNGKCSVAAVLFDLLGDREAAEYFARMSTAGYSERERGHTGNFFNVFWAMPGVSRSGPTATAAYRGAGRPDIAYAIERLVSHAAAELGIDAAEIRRRNFIPREAFPYRTPTHSIYDNADLHGLLRKALAAADWEGFALRRAASAARHPGSRPST